VACQVDFITTRCSGVEPQKVGCLLRNAVPPGGCDDSDGAADAKGEYFQYTISSTDTTLADGRTVTVFYTYQFSTSNQPDDPPNNAAGECLGRMVLSKEGKAIAGSGSSACTAFAGAGIFLPIR
jgi:hypothetical protein